MKGILMKKEQSWRHHTYWFQTIPPGYSNQNIIDLIGEFCGENSSLCSLEEILSTLIADVSKMDLGLPLDSCL